MARRARNGVIYSGPLFEGDPAKRVGQNIADLATFYAREGAGMMRAQFVPGRGSELASTVAERKTTLRGRTYVSGVYSTMTGPDPRNPNPHSWVTFAETGRRRIGGANTPAGRFKGFRMWSRVTAALKRQVKEEVVRLKVMKGIV